MGAEHVVWSIVKYLIILLVVMGVVPFMIVMERKVIAWMQDRLGPNRVPLYGWTQGLVDGVKLMFKETFIPAKADKWVYLAAPIVSMIPALASFVVIPFGPKAQPVDINVAVLYILGLGSVAVYGVVLAGWSSNSKYSLLGGLRSSAQMISYELGVGVATVCVVMVASVELHRIHTMGEVPSALSLKRIVEAQSYPLQVFGHEIPFVRNYFVFHPLLLPAFIIFLIGGFAEVNRAPFDLPEAETELVAGFHTEYPGMWFAMFFLGEYANIITVSSMVTTLFLGGWLGPGVPSSPENFWQSALGLFYFLAKMFVLIFSFMWARATLTRIRYDQLMQYGWTRLLPWGLANVFVILLWEAFKR